MRFNKLTNEYTKQTQTKFISSSFKGVPELKNEYGSLNNLLKIILTEKYNTQLVLDSSTMSNLLTLTLNINHGFTKDQVIILKEVDTDDAPEVQFRVLSTTLNSVIVDNSLNSFSFTEGNYLEISGAPLGYTVAYENAEEGVLCIQNSSTTSPAILRSIDKLPPNSYSPSWSKYARVTIGQTIDEQGRFLDNIKAPYHPDFPYAEETGNSVAGAGGIHGFAKWRYSLGNNYEPVENRVPTGSFPTRWRVVGDSKTFYLMIHTTGLSDTSYSFDLVGYGNFQTYNTEETSNVCLQATNGFYSSNSNPDYAPTRPRSFFGALNYGHSGYLLTDVYGSHKSGYNYFKNIGEYLSTDNPQHPWRTVYIQTINPETSQWMLGKLIIKDHLNYIRGEHRGIRIIYGKSLLPDMNITDEGTLSLEVQEPRYMSEFSKMVVVFTLKDWE